MTNYDRPLSTAELSPLTHNQVQQTLHVGITLDHIQNPVQFGDYVVTELGIARDVAEANGQSPNQGQAALLGLALGTAANSPQKAQIFSMNAAKCMDLLTGVGMEDEDKSFVWNAATHIAKSGANTAVILDVVAGIDGYAASREEAGADASLVRTTLYAMGFGASTIDQQTKNSMAVQLRKQVK